MTDYQILNAVLKRNPYTLPLIPDIMLSIKSFKWATCIDLNMGYYSMSLIEASKQLCVTCLPWVLYQYNMLPMGVKVATDVFQQAMSSLFNDLEGAIVYLDDIIILGAESFGEHVMIVSDVLRRLEYQGLQVNRLKIFWGQHQVEYLDFLITRDRIKP